MLTNQYAIDYILVEDTTQSNRKVVRFMRFVCKNSPIITVGQWVDTENASTFYDLYINGKFDSRFVNFNELMAQITAVIIGGETNVD